MALVSTQSATLWKTPRHHNPSPHSHPSVSMEPFHFCKRAFFSGTPVLFTPLFLVHFVKLQRNNICNYLSTLRTSKWLSRLWIRGKMMPLPWNYQNNKRMILAISLGRIIGLKDSNFGPQCNLLRQCHYPKRLEIKTNKIYLIKSHPNINSSIFNFGNK